MPKKSSKTTEPVVAETTVTTPVVAETAAPVKEKKVKAVKAPKLETAPTPVVYSCCCFYPRIG